MPGLYHKPLMELRHLRYFQAVAEELSFTRAAQRLFTVQSTVSAAVRALETDLKTTLFDRSTRRVERSNKVVFRSVSSARTAAETVDCTVNNRCAARVKLSSSATATKYSSWRLSTESNYRI